MNAVILGALVGGIIVGAIPGIAGMVKGKTGYAIGGFITCVIANLLLGLFLSIPACVVFMFLIFRQDSTASGGDQSNSDHNNIKYQ